MKLTLPYPPSANNYWRVFKGIVTKTPEARRYQKFARLKAMTEGAMRPLLGPIVLELVVYRPRRIGDLDNALKIVLDAMQGVLYVDDTQVVEIHARREDDASNPRVVIRARGEVLEAANT